MEDIIKELESILDTIQDEEDREVMYLAILESMNKAANDIEYMANKERAKGETDEQKIKNNIYSSFSADPEAFTGMTQREKDELFARCTNLVKENNEPRTRTIRLLKGFINYLNLDEPEIFLEFPKLALLFNSININVNTQLKIIAGLITVNANLDDSAPDDHIYLPNAEAIVDYDYKYMDLDELYDIFCENRFEDFLHDEEYPNKQAKQEVVRRYEETKIDCTDIQHACDKLNVILEKRSEETTEEDYQAIIENMEIIHFGNLAHRLIKKIKKGKELNERKKAAEADTKKTKEEVTSVEIIKPKYSKKQINQVHYQISKLYDLEHFKEKTVLSLDEIIYILSLMYSIEMDESAITKFLSRAMHNYHKNNPFWIFYQSYDKFSSFDDEQIKEHLEMIEYILSDVNIFICDEETYQETKILVEDELAEIINILSGNYTYEINAAKNLLKRKEGNNNERSN